MLVLDVVLPQLKAYVDVHGKLPLTNVQHAGVRVGMLCVRLRRIKKRLSEDEIRRVEREVPGWWWSCFDKMHAILKNYLETHENITPTHDIVWKHEPVGLWCCTQRAAFRKGRLSGSRIRRLEELQGWHWTPMHAFEVHLARVRDFAHGNSDRLPNAAEAQDMGIACWWDTQLRLYHCGQLQPQRVAALEALPGWGGWNDARQARFNKNVESLQAKGSVPVFGEALGWWCNRQKELRSTNRLSKTRAAALESLPGWDWDSHQDLVIDTAPPTPANPTPQRTLRVSTRLKSARRSARAHRRPRVY